MLDKLSLTIHRAPDKRYLETHGEIVKNVGRTQLYKFLIRLKTMTVLIDPHKFGENINARIAFTKVDMNPKYYEHYNNLLEELFLLFDDPDLCAEEFNVSRFDIASDIEDLSTYFLLSLLHIRNIRQESFDLKKGTIYFGSNPRGRIYNKDREIRNSLKNHKTITVYEKRLIESGKSWVRFEIMKRHPGMSLKELAADPVKLVSLYDCLEFFDYAGNEIGILQFQHRNINRKFRNTLERFKKEDLLMMIKSRYVENVSSWFGLGEPF